MGRKNKNKKSVQQNANKVIQVKSSTYGKHTRAPRGSKTTATVNEVLAANAEKTNTLNTAAKTIYDLLKLYSDIFREGQLWQTMLSRMRKVKDTHFEKLLYTLNGLELNSRYALSRFGYLAMLTIKNNKKELQIEMDQDMPPYLNQHDNCYQYELIGMLFNGKGNCIQHARHATKWFNKKEAMHKQVFNFQKPAGAKYYLLCLHLQSGMHGVARDTFPSRGMAIVGVGSVLEEKGK